MWKVGIGIGESESGDKMADSQLFVYGRRHFADGRPRDPVLERARAAPVVFFFWGGFFLRGPTMSFSHDILRHKNQTPIFVAQ